MISLLPFFTLRNQLSPIAESRSIWIAFLFLNSLAGMMIVPPHRAVAQDKPQVPATRGEASDTIKSNELDALLRPLIERHAGDVCLSLRHLESGTEYHWRSEVPQPTASLIKLPVMITAYRMAESGQLDLTKMVTLKEEDKVPGSGILTDHLSAGLSLSVRDAVRLMIRYSDNTATNLVIDQIGLPATSSMMEALGLPNTRLHAKVFRGDTSIAPERSKQFGLGSTTSLEMVRLLQMLVDNKLVAPDRTAEILNHLAACDDQTKIAGDLPKGAKFAHKTGAVGASRTDAGILTGPGGTILICVLTTNNTDQRWEDDNAAQVLCGQIGRVVYDYFNRPAAVGTVTASAELRSGSLGITVEMLQRTLNARVVPSPGLSVDGDFGPSTEKAVRSFQEQQSLPVSGVADNSTLKALGPLLEAEPVDPPEIVNNDPLPLQPPDSLDGPPFVTCRAWTIVDGDTGATLFSSNATQQLDFASTTKIMTAWLVIQLAQDSPEVLDEVITMSDRADETIGSTSGLRSGESVSVREALYGLMLPSGNDMSVALAEHFGSRLAPPSANELTDPLEQFVAAMNSEAQRLGMEDTHYMNPHGLTHPEHLSTATDLAVLARAAFQSPVFQHYVGTRKHGVLVKGLAGYERNVVWENTNQLLGIDGYSGVKTGTTDRAGACLVSTGTRNGRRLFMVVLGSAASESRYADSRNLYRWAWQELQRQSD